MCMSVPQIADRWTLISTSLCPTEGSGMSCIQIPGSARALTRAFMVDPLANDAEFAPGPSECADHGIELLRGMGRVHLRADARLPLRDDREGECDDVDPRHEHALGKPHRERRIAEHDRDDRVLAGQQIEAERLHPRAEMSGVCVHPLAQIRGTL